MNERIKEIEKEYTQKQQPFFDKRSDVVNGKYEPTYKEFNEEHSDENINNDPTKIHDFWLKTLKNSEIIQPNIHPPDEPILSCVENIKMINHYDEKDYESFSLEFQFNEQAQAYFSNQTLTKRFYLKEDDGDETLYEKGEGTVINWVEGKNVTRKLVKKKQKNKRTNETRHITKEVEAESFFLFFKSYTMPTEEELTEMKDEEQEKVTMEMERDLEIGEELENEIVPNAISFYLGENGTDEEENDKDQTNAKTGVEPKNQDDPNKQECKNQ